MYKEPSYIPGEKVIVRSNEDEPVLVGTFKRFLHHRNEGNNLPIVEVDGEDLYCFAMVCAYSDELLEALQSKGGKEGWYWLKDQKNKSK